MSGSNDYARFKTQFATAARKFIESGACSEADLKEMGGFAKSTKPGAIYFTYCGGMDLGNRIYLDALTGRTFR